MSPPKVGALALHSSQSHTEVVMCVPGVYLTLGCVPGAYQVLANRRLVANVETIWERLSGLGGKH